MEPVDDSALLRQFAENHSDEAFAELVTRHVNLVYSVALRQVGHPQNAEEITQAVFIILAKKAAGLRHEKALSSWLFQATRFTAINFMRSEIRRQNREQEAQMQTILNESGGEVWPKIAPLLDDAVAALREKERQVIVLRFYEGRSLREVGLALGASEDAAKKRVGRALEKLRQSFAKRGVDSTTAAIAETISAHSVQIAPLALAKTISAVAVAKGATASASTLTLIKGALKIMAWTKAKTAVTVGVAAIVAVGTTTAVVKTVEYHKNANLENYFVHFETMDLDKAPPVLILRPSRYARQVDCIITTKPDLHDYGKVMRRGCGFAAILSSAYDFGTERIVLPADVPRGRFDLLLTLPSQPAEALRAAIKKQFGFVGYPETRDTDVLVMKISNPAATGIKVNTQHKDFTINWRKGELAIVNFKMSDIAYCLGTGTFNLPVIDETGLTDSYDFVLHWNGNLNLNDQNKDIERALKEQIGLELVHTNMPIEMLVVEKAK